MSASLDKNEIYSVFYPKVKAYVSNRLNNKSDVDDVVSDVFLRVYENLGSFDEQKASLSTWIYTITHNTVVTYFRNNANHAASEFVDEQFSTEENDDYDSLLSLLADSLETLPEIQKDIIMLHYYYQMDHKQIASKMNVSYAYVRKQCSLGLIALRKLMKDTI